MTTVSPVYQLNNKQLSPFNFQCLTRGTNCGQSLICFNEQNQFISIKFEILKDIQIKTKSD